MLTLIFNLSYVGRVLRSLFWFAVPALCLFIVLQHSPFDPNLARLATKLGLDSQKVVGEEVRIRMARDGHFWAEVSLNGVRRRMLVDSGATITALSQTTANIAAIDHAAGLLPVMMRTADGTIVAHTGTLEQLDLGGIEALDLKVVVSPGLGNIDVLGMNFLSKLESCGSRTERLSWSRKIGRARRRSRIQGLAEIGAGPFDEYIVQVPSAVVDRERRRHRQPPKACVFEMP